MSELANSRGFFLAELPRLFHELRAPYLEWAADYGRPEEESLAHYRRALIGWYEARKDATEPYTGDVFHYVTTVAEVYFSGRHTELFAAEESARLTASPEERARNPLNHLPKPLPLDEVQQLMLRQFRQLGKRCREMLLLADYHGLIMPRIATALDMDGQVEEATQLRRKCLLMVREHWQATGILDPVIVPSPADEQLIDRYYDGKLSVGERWEVEARRPTDPVFRRAMDLREDWQAVIAVAGRQDLMETLEREEGRYVERPTAPPVVTAAPTGAAAAEAAAEPVELTPRRPRFGVPRMGRPNLPIILALVLLGGFGYLAWDTFSNPRASTQLYAAYFAPLPNVFDGRDSLSEDERDLDRILYYYDRRDYATAYDELLPVAQYYPAAPLYLGVSALALGQPTRAQQWLAQVPPGDAYYPPAQWYEALAYLGQNRTPAAASLLDQIAGTPGHPYRGRAVELLGKL